MTQDILDNILEWKFAKWYFSLEGTFKFATRGTEAGCIFRWPAAISWRSTQVGAAISREGFLPVACVHILGLTLEKPGPERDPQSKNSTADQKIQFLANQPSGIGRVDLPIAFTLWQVPAKMQSTV